MQLRLIRFHLLIPLIVSLINVKASEESSRFAMLTPSPRAMRFQQVSSYSLRKNNENGFESPNVEGFVTREDQKRRETQRRRDAWRDSNAKSDSTMIGISNQDQSTRLLAEKLAQDALRSKEMQDTIRELSALKNDDKQKEEVHNKTDKVIEVQTTTTTMKTTRAKTTQDMESTEKTTVKNKAHGKHKAHDKRKHNKHKKPDRKPNRKPERKQSNQKLDEKQERKHHHPKRRLKRLYSKKDSSKTTRKRKSIDSINGGRRRRGLKEKCSSEESVTCRRKRSSKVELTKKNSDHKLRENPEQNSIEQPPNFESKHIKSRTIPNENDSQSMDRKRSHMIAKLMQTTTRDPTKKKPGDQGVEYSEYYSENENILSPETRVRSASDDVVRETIGGQVRSIRETGDGNLLDADYYDSAEDQQFQEDINGLKRNGGEAARVVQVPSNSMEYVDNTYEPAVFNGGIDNERMSGYSSGYDYIPDQSARSNLLGEGSGRRVLTANHGSASFGRGSNAISSFGSGNPLVNGVGSRQSGLLGNVISPQSLQRNFADGNFPRYSINVMPSSFTTSSRTTSAAFSAPSLPQNMVNSFGRSVNEPENEKMAELNGFQNSSLSGFEPYTLSHEISSLHENNRILGSGTTARVVSEVRVTPRPHYASMTPYGNSVEMSSQLREPEVKYFNYNDGVENIRGPPQIESIASRETAHQNTPAQAASGNTKHCNSTKTVGTTIAATPASSSSVPSTSTSSSSSTGTSTSTLSSLASSSSPSTTSKSSISSPNSTGATEAGKQAVSNGTMDVTHNSVSTMSSQSLLTFGSSVTPPANRTPVVNDTKAIASEILSEIIGELEELRLENPQNEQREGLPCKLTGSWVTTRAGVRIDMNVTNHSVKVSLDHLTPPITTEGLLNVTWNVTGFAPFKRGGPFTLLATNNHTKTLAVFVGACKVCQGIDTIEGSWTISREPRDCRDFQMSINIFNEIFRRTRLYSAIRDKQSKPESQSSSTTSGNNSTTESPVTSNDLLDNLVRSRNHTLSFIGIE